MLPLALLFLWLPAAIDRLPADRTVTQTFTAREAGEAIADITAGCERCDWGVE